MTRSGCGDRDQAVIPAVGAQPRGHCFDPAPIIDAAGCATREAASAHGLELAILAMPDAPRLTCGDPERLGAALSLALAETIAAADPGCLFLRLVGDGHGGRIVISTHPAAPRLVTSAGAPRLDAAREIAHAAGAELLAAGRAGLGWTVQFVLPATGPGTGGTAGQLFAGVTARLDLPAGATARALGDWLSALGIGLAEGARAQAADLVVREAGGAPAEGGLVVALADAGAAPVPWADMVLALPLTIGGLDRIRDALVLRRAARRDAGVADLFDLATLRRLRRATEAGNGGFVAGLLRLYRLQAPAAFDRAGEAIARGDLASAAEALGALESMSRDIGARAVAAGAVDLARELRRAGAGPGGTGQLERLLVAALRRLPGELGLALDASRGASPPHARLN